MGSNQVGLFAGGVLQTGKYKSTTTYDFAARTARAGGNLSFARVFGSACGTTEYACIGGTSNTINSTTDKYDYASNTVNAFAVLAKRTRHSMGAASNDQHAFFVGGTYTGYEDPAKDVDYLNFSTQTVISAAGLAVPTSYISGCGNLESGYFGGGFTKALDGPSVPISTLLKYQYSNGSLKSSMSLSDPGIGYAATSNHNTGLFAAPNSVEGSSSVIKLQFANDTTISGTNLVAMRTSTAGCSNKMYALFAGSVIAGGSLNTAVSDMYDYATNAVSSSTTLDVGRQFHTATSNVHGGL